MHGVCACVLRVIYTISSSQHVLTNIYEMATRSATATSWNTVCTHTCNYNNNYTALHTTTSVHT
jgi:hypothetical protein